MLSASRRDGGTRQPTPGNGSPPVSRAHHRATRSDQNRQNLWRARRRWTWSSCSSPSSPSAPSTSGPRSFASSAPSGQAGPGHPPGHKRRGRTGGRMCKRDRMFAPTFVLPLPPYVPLLPCCGRISVPAAVRASSTAVLRRRRAGSLTNLP